MLQLNGIHINPRVTYADDSDPVELTTATLRWLEGIDWTSVILWCDDQGFEVKPQWLVLYAGQLPDAGVVEDYPLEAALEHEAEVTMDGYVVHSVYCRVDLEITHTGPWLVVKAIGLDHDFC